MMALCAGNDLTPAGFSTSPSDDQGEMFAESCTSVPDLGVDR